MLLFYQCSCHFSLYDQNEDTVCYSMLTSCAPVPRNTSPQHENSINFESDFWRKSQESAKRRLEHHPEDPWTTIRWSLYESRRFSLPACYVLTVNSIMSSLLLMTFVFSHSLAQLMTRCRLVSSSALLSRVNLNSATLPLPSTLWSKVESQLFWFSPDLCYWLNLNPSKAQNP